MLATCLHHQQGFGLVPLQTVNGPASPILCLKSHPPQDDPYHWPIKIHPQRADKREREVEEERGAFCLYGCYVHSSIIPTFHRRCYWLLQNPDIVLVHYLNVPAIEDCGKPCGPILCSINTDKKEWAKWTKEELIGQLKPMFHGIKWTCSNGNSSTGFSAEQLVQQILDSHQTKPPPRTHNCLCTGNLGAGSSLHHKCNSAKHRIISPKVDTRAGGAYGSSHSEVQNNDVSEGKTEHTHGGGKNGRTGGDGGTGGREKRNGKVPKPALLHQNSMEVSSTNQVEVPDTTQSSPVSISSGLNSDPDMADSPVVAGMGHVASVMSSLSQSSTVFMSEVSGDPVYSMSPSVDPNAHLLGPDTASSSLVLAVTADSHKFAFAGAVGVGLADAGSAEGLGMMSTSGVSEELLLSSNLESGSIKLPETNMNFDPDCFLNNPKQGQTYGGNGLKTEESNSSSCRNGGLRCSPPLNDNGYTFNPSLVKNIKTEDTSFEQQLANESGYQVGEVVSGSSSSGSQNSLALTPTGSLLPSGGGLSPSTTLEQMDFSAIDAKQEYPTSVMSAAGYGHSAHLAHQSHSPSFFLQGSPQSTQTQAHQNNSASTQNSHDSNAYMGLSVVKTQDSTGTNGHLHHHHHTHAASNCNGGSPTERNGQAGALQLLQYQSRFSNPGQEHDDVGGLEQPTRAEPGDGGGQEKESDCVLKPGDHLQTGGGGEAEGVGGTEQYLQQPAEGSVGTGATGARVESGTLCNGGEGNANSSHQQLQPLLQGAGLVQGLFSTVGAHQSLGGNGTNAGGSMEINLDHFDVSFGNQFSDLINDFISVEGGNGAAVVAGANALYGHQLMTHTGTEGQVSSGTAAQQGADEGGHGARGYNSAELCLQPCCSPQSSQAGAVTGEAGQLAYMQVAEAVSAAVAHGNMGMLQVTGRLFVVTDYSPEWSYPEGGVKVLITGPWQEASSEYTCLFDQITVPASLIQPGVLRCYCPAHDTGLVTFQVAASSQIISNSVVFEYKARALPALPSSQHDWLSLDDNQFRMSILERLEQMERRMAEMAGQQQQGTGGMTESGGSSAGGGDCGRSSSEQAQFSAGQSQNQGPGSAGSSFESRVVVVCEKMMNRACWAKSKHLIHSKTFRGMTLLHLAAAQGYTTLIQTLIKWRTKHADSIDLELEVDPLNVDHFSCTPLMWACALGHMEAAVVLYKWDRRALAIPDSLGRLPLAIARSRGHTKLAECLESLQREEQQSGAMTTTPSMPFSPSAEASAAEGWMNVWGSETTSTGLKDSSINSSASSSSSDLRRPRSEPSSFYSSVSHGDAPLSKKHKPNPETHQARPSKPCSAPLRLDDQAHKSKSCPSKPREANLDKEPGNRGEGSTCGGGRWSSRQAAGRRLPTGGLGKERLANRLRLKETASAGAISDLRTSQENLENTGDLQNMNMMALAEEVIEASSDRIKRENFGTSETTLDSVGVSNWLTSYLGDAERFLFNKPLTSTPGLGTVHGQPDLEGPIGKLGLQSPAEWTALLNASHSKEERDLTQIALSDPEQRELYEAARQVQNTFRKYKGRPLREQQELAAAVIQRCYKRYKQYALYKKMTLAAILIQSKFRSYHEQKKFQQSRRAAMLIQQYYRSYKELGRPSPSRRAAAAALVQHKLRSSLLTKRQDQAARKIMRFLLRCRHRSAPGAEGSAGMSGGNRRIQQTQAQVDEVVDIMRVNVDKVLERDQKLSDLDDRADALQIGASQFETSAAKLKRKYWWKNVKMWAILIAVILIIIIIIIGFLNLNAFISFSLEYTVIINLQEYREKTACDWKDKENVKEYQH
ncbi:Calmodulin-binding transcription activator 1 [Triplophysa tibetana]|uniref:Calmodulin-binding transcription activator 1 n=1 Tax=Triplophysa tibetana TaxID=1572043 RepID=A0A5A9NCY2_9TELE|nr:Calmodulin-binding transcription activator 1 [Triplophysa tibetana]